MPLSKKFVTSGNTTAMAGDTRYGAPGGSRSSSMFILSYEVADELAKELGISSEKAHRMIIAFGRIAQKLLLKGTPVGIPHVGTIILHQQRRMVNPRGIINSLTARGIAVNMDPAITTKIQKKLMIKVPMILKRVISDNAMYSGSIKDHRKAALVKLKNKLKSYRGGGLKHRGLEK